MSNTDCRLIEFFSPYCGHCQAFAPTWKKVIEDHGAKWDEKSFHLAQVNCIENADLCTEHGVDRFPTIKLYRNSKPQDRYAEARDYDTLVSYIETQVTRFGRLALPNPSGKAVALTVDDFAKKTAKGPWFVKFFAPWCGYCKKLAPIWEQLGEEMKGKVNIASVNCDENKKLCDENKVRGYPTLKFFQNGQSTDYRMGRDLDNLMKFAAKAAQADLTSVGVADLDRIEQDDEVAFLLVGDQEKDKEFMEAAQGALSSVLGFASLYKSSDPALLKRFEISSSPALVVLKKGRYALTQTKETLSEWVESQRYPVIVELTQSTYKYIMENAGLMVLGIFSNVNPEKLAQDKSDLESIALAYLDEGTKGVLKTPTPLSEKVAEERRVNKYVSKKHPPIPRDVAFAWLDGVQWGHYAKETFGVELYRLPAIIISDGLKYEYYEQDVNRSKIEMTRENIFGALKGIMEGELEPRSTKGSVERFLLSILDTWHATTSAITARPFTSVAVLSVFGALLYCTCCRTRRSTSYGPKFD